MSGLTRHATPKIQARHSNRSGPGFPHELGQFSY